MQQGLLPILRLTPKKDLVWDSPGRKIKAVKNKNNKKVVNLVKEIAAMKRTVSQLKSKAAGGNVDEQVEDLQQRSPVTLRVPLRLPSNTAILHSGSLLTIAIDT